MLLFKKIELGFLYRALMNLFYSEPSGYYSNFKYPQTRTTGGGRTEQQS